MDIEYKTYRKPRPSRTAPNTDTQYIYGNSASATGVTAGVGGNTNDSFVPSGWSANPVNLTAAAPYEWTAERTRPDSTSDWTNFGNAMRWDEEFHVPDGIGVRSTEGAYVAIKSFTTSISVPTGSVDITPTPAFIRSYGDVFPTAAFLDAEDLIT